MPRCVITRRLHFSAAHRLWNPQFSDAENEAIFGVCNNPNFHGHNYDLDISIEGEIDPATGYVIAPMPVLFGSLTTEVSQDRFTFWFGIGWFRRSFLLSEIQSCTTVSSPWYYGWGIHMMRDGWLYNVSGSQAVELKLVSGKMLRVGTDEPAELCRAIRMMKG